MLRLILRGFALIIGFLVAAILVRSGLWHRDTRGAVQTIAHAAAIGGGPPFDSLPPPVQAYFRKVLPPNPPLIASAVATQDAEFFINNGWRPLTATQHFRVSPPAFVWDARIRMAPLMPALVRDSYIDGRGGMQASLFGAYSLVDQADTPELNAGALQRFLGEAVWIPTALLPSAAVSWAPRDDRSALVTLRDGGNLAALVFEFDDTGMVRRISGDRYQERQGEYTLRPWSIECSEPGTHSGLVIPMRCEVSWNNDGKIEPYWRGRITRIDYTFE